ncbi:transmembrane protein [Cystoisospora suis]|uniref:Transmembrane protein n=1 Tax=Cystoisospora suis TaxID=483139 RepID=A0A2C6KR91_9APIC|nr:transmembrane protein [Cystoisospora suis]
MVITFLLVFKIEELGYHAFAGFVRSCPALPMYLLLEFLFDTKALSTAARAEWLRHYDMDYIDNVILSRLQKLTGPFSNLLESLRVLSTASAVGPITGQPDPKALDPNEFTGKAESGRVSHLLETSGYTAQAKTPSSTDAAQHLPVAGTTPDVLGLRPKLLKEGPTGISPLANPPPPSLNKYAVHLGVSDGIRQLCSEVARLAGQKQKELGHEGKGAVQEGVGRVQDTSRRADVDPRQTPDKPDKPAREGTAKGAGSLREAEKEDEEEDEDEDLWMKDIDGEETFLGRKADRQRKKRAHEEKGAVTPL